MSPTIPQSQGALVDLSEATRRRNVVLLTGLVEIFVELIACITEVLLKSEGVSLPRRAGLLLIRAALAPVARELEALAAERRALLPEPEERPRAADGTPISAPRIAPDAFLRPLARPPSSAPVVIATVLKLRAAGLHRPTAGPSPPPVPLERGPATNRLCTS